MTTPTAADVARIAALHDDVVRNLLITHCYHELATALRQHTGSGANWCVFATWASKQAGRTIRGEDLRETLRARLIGSDAIRHRLVAVAAAVRALRPDADTETLLERTLRAAESQPAFARAAAAVALGNLRVFEEIALQFAVFLETLDHAADSGEERFGEFLMQLRPGDPPDGQDLLRDAFGAYLAAWRHEDASARAQLMFRANLLIGLHEQTRLQPQIAAALDAAFDADALRSRLLAELLPAPWLRLRYRLAALFGRRPPLDLALDALLVEVQRELRRTITAEAMTLQFPGDVIIHLGRDLAATFPPRLLALTDPDLTALLQRIDPTPDSVRDSGASDWADLDERMHLITDLFRCHHETETLFDPPFDDKQLRALRNGTRPPGRL